MRKEAILAQPEIDRETIDLLVDPDFGIVGKVHNWLNQYWWAYARNLAILLLYFRNMPFILMLRKWHGVRNGIDGS